MKFPENVNHQQLLKHEYSQIGMWECTFRGLDHFSSQPFNYMVQLYGIVRFIYHHLEHHNIAGSHATQWGHLEPVVVRNRNAPDKKLVHMLDSQYIHHGDSELADL